MTTIFSAHFRGPTPIMMGLSLGSRPCDSRACCSAGETLLRAIMSEAVRAKAVISGTAPLASLATKVASSSKKEGVSSETRRPPEKSLMSLPDHPKVPMLALSVCATFFRNFRACLAVNCICGTSASRFLTSILRGGHMGLRILKFLMVCAAIPPDPTSLMDLPNSSLKAHVVALLTHLGRASASELWMSSMAGCMASSWGRRSSSPPSPPGGSLP